MIETLPAVFEMDEIIYELRDQITALSYGALNQAFSLIRSLDSRKSQIFSDRDSIESYHHAVSEVLIKTAHLRSCLALGAMATEVPDREDVEANQRAMSALKSKAERAVRAGCDGMWVTHRGSVATAMSIFDNDLPTPNQLYVTRDDVNIARDILLAPPPGRPSEAEFRDNIRVAVQFIETWLSGRGSLIVDGRREDTASVELRRGQIWQWIHHRVKLDTRQKVSSAMFETTLGDVLKFIKADIGNDAWRDGRYREAAALLKTLSTAAVLDPAFSKRASRKLS
jgi:malate synthase